MQFPQEEVLLEWPLGLSQHFIKTCNALDVGLGKKKKSLIEIFLIIISSALLQAISSQRQYQPKFIPTLVPSAAEGVVEYNYIQLV